MTLPAKTLPPKCESTAPDRKVSKNYKTAVVWALDLQRLSNNLYNYDITDLNDQHESKEPVFQLVQHGGM